MSDSNRRGFLKVAGAGVTAAGVAAVAVAQGTQSASAAVAEAPLPASAKREMLIHVRDVHTGSISLMVEGREITVHDRELATRLARALHDAGS